MALHTIFVRIVKREQLLRLNVSIYIILSELRTERFEFARENAMLPYTQSLRMSPYL